MASYILRKLEREPWPEFKARAALERKTVDQALKALIRYWASGAAIPAVWAEREPLAGQVKRG